MARDAEAGALNGSAFKIARAVAATPLLRTCSAMSGAPASLHWAIACSLSTNPHNASKRCSAITISGLACGSLYMRAGASSAMPAAFSRANPVAACAAVGCVCSDSGWAAANNFTMNGNSPTSSARYDGAGRCRLSSICAGPRGCVPYQISAQGRPSAVISRSSGNAKRSPHA